MIWPVLLVVLSLSAACGRGKEKAATGKKEAPPQPVAVEMVATGSAPVRLFALGTVEAAESVGVKSQVAGMLAGVHFREGADVKPGDLLFTIDPAPFQNSLRQAEAILSRDRSTLEKAWVEANRNAEMLERGLISQSEADTTAVAVRTLQATVEADQAAVENARLQLGYTRIVAPMAGRAGRLMASPGSLVKAGADEPLVVIDQVSPVEVSFGVPERNLPAIRRRMASGALAAQALVTGEEERPEEGRVTFIENEVDRATGTIRLAATYPNANRRLWPGQFVRVVIDLERRDGVVIVPGGAVQSGQKGSFVYVVNADSTVTLRPVKATEAEGGVAVVDEGLAAGEKIVVDGHLRLVPGAKVQAQESAPPGRKK
jgi:multidrug efflux system membrane fusion protein